MQWIFAVVGLLLGWMLDESPGDALIGALLGLGVAQALRQARLERESAAQQRELTATRAELTTVLQRLDSLEREPAAEISPAFESPAMAVEPVPSATVESAPELDLVWELPPEPTVAAATVDAWTASPASSQPALPRTPNLIERALGAARAWLLGGNTVLRVGVLLLFLGLAFLLRYATEGLVVPIELRYAGVAGCAIGLLGLGWWLRRRNRGYALILQGSAIAVLYLTIFAAMRLHPLLEPSAGFGLLVLVTAFSAILAITQDALGLAAAAALGGFAAPILASTGSGDHVALFSYFALLNAGIFVIAWFKAWRLLNLIGFVGTFGIGFAWGARDYTPELFWSTEPFLVLFFLMYLAIGLLVARRKLQEWPAQTEEPSRSGRLRGAARQGDYVDGTLLFGPPLVGFGLQFALVRHLPLGAAFSALILGLLYLALARPLMAKRTLLLGETCLALGVIFASLAIPLGLDARWTAAAWAVEGAGIFWLGLRQQRPFARAFALLLQVGAALAFLSELRVGDSSLLAGSAMGALLLGAALLSSFWQLHRAPHEQLAPWERWLGPWLAGAGLIGLYLVAPLNLLAQGTSIAWALAGLATLLAGLRLGSRTFLVTACAVQLLAGGLFLLHLQDGAGDPTVWLMAGWSGLLCGGVLGLCLMAATLWITRTRGHAGALRPLALGLLVGLALIDLGAFLTQHWPIANGVWVANALVAFWLSLYLRLSMGRLMAMLLQIFACTTLWLAGDELLRMMPGEGLRPLLHGGFWAAMALGLAAALGAWYLQRSRAAAFGGYARRRTAQVMLALGLAWGGLALASEISRFLAPVLQTSWLLGLLALGIGGLAWLARRLRYRDLGLLCTLLAPIALAMLLSAFHARYHPAANLGLLAWPLVIAVHFLVLRHLAGLLPARALGIAHIFGCWLVLTLLALELRYALLALAEQYNAWRWLGWAVVPSLYLLLMAAPRQWSWPVARFVREYRWYAAVPVALWMFGWFWLVNAFSDGSAEPLPYLPLLNPLELGLLFALFALSAWSREALKQWATAPGYVARGLQGVLGLSLFAFISVAVMRAAYQWAGVPFELSVQLDSMLVQASLSLVWTLAALGLMIGGHLRRRREVWLAGAVLIALVVAKLFFIELSNRGGMARIVSFIGVGGLLLVVGYFAPLPPKKTPAESAKTEQGAAS